MSMTNILDLVIGSVVSFCFGCIFMFILSRISIIPEWSRWVLLVLVTFALTKLI